MSLDPTDRRLLHVLQRRGRISNADLAEEVNLSASACPATIFVEITLTTQADEVLDAFEKAVSRVPDVLECHLTAGTADYILKVVAEDTEDFARIHRQYLTRLPGVAKMQSSFALRTVFKTTALPL